MRCIEIRNLRATPEGNVEMVVAATGKALILSMASIRHRNGNLIFVENWLYAKLAPYLAPQGRTDHGCPAERDRQNLFRDGYAGPAVRPPVS